MGEIGYSRQEALYELKLWEIILIIRGYRRRQRIFCDMVRWQTYISLMPHADLAKNGINAATDLIRFPWDETEDEEDGTNTTISDEEVQRLRDLIRQENESAGK